MSEENSIRVKLYRDGTVVQELNDGTTRVLESDSDWARVDAMTDEDAEYNALMDPDFEPFLTDEDREKIKTLPDPKRIRKKLKLTQKEFSRRYEIPLGTLRDWERRARTIGYLDEGYSVAQLWLADWERLDGDALAERAEKLLTEIEPLKVH